MILMEKNVGNELRDELEREFRSLTDAEKRLLLDEIKEKIIRKRSIAMMESRNCE